MGQEKQMTFSDKIRVATSNLNGFGVIANCAIGRGMRIAKLTGMIVPAPTRYSVTVCGQHVEPMCPMRFLNHSCDPNAYFINLWLIALRPLQNGEEITINYLTTEPQLSHPFTCSCPCHQQSNNTPFIIGPHYSMKPDAGFVKACCNTSGLPGVYSGDIGPSARFDRIIFRDVTAMDLER